MLVAVATSNLISCRMTRQNTVSVTARDSRSANSVSSAFDDRSIGAYLARIDAMCRARACANTAPTAGMARSWRSNWTTKPPNLPNQR